MVFQSELFPKENFTLVKTVHETNRSCLEAINQLYLHGKLDCDPTFGNGCFYKRSSFQPVHKSDLEPRQKNVLKLDVRHLPLLGNSIKSIIFDPPFICKSKGEKEAGIIKQRYGFIGSSMPELFSFYKECLKEFHRILRVNGILVFKCMDVVEGRKNVFSHVEVMIMARELGFTPADLFIVTSKFRIKPHKLIRQWHARKHHAYFWVFRKARAK